MIIRTWLAAAPYIDGLCGLDFECFGRSKWSRSTWKGLFHNRNLTLILEFDGSSPIAFCVYNIAPPEVELLKIGVVEEHRKKSLGALLMEQMLTDLKNQEGIEVIFLEARKDNQNAIDFYRQLRFKIIGKRKNYYKDPSTDAVIMAFRLANF